MTKVWPQEKVGQRWEREPQKPPGGDKSPGAAPPRAVLGTLILGLKGKALWAERGKGYRTQCGTERRSILELHKTYYGMLRGGTKHGEREGSWWFGKE